MYYKKIISMSVSETAISYFVRSHWSSSSDILHGIRSLVWTLGRSHNNLESQRHSSVFCHHFHRLFYRYHSFHRVLYPKFLSVCQYNAGMRFCFLSWNEYTSVTSLNYQRTRQCMHAPVIDSTAAKKLNQNLWTSHLSSDFVSQFEVVARRL